VNLANILLDLGIFIVRRATFLVVLMSFVKIPFASKRLIYP